MDLRIRSVNLGRVRVIGYNNDGAVLSGIDKHPAASDSVFVRATGIDGDEQADLSVHGGVDKAVYAYPSAHWPWWESEKRLSCRPATFGENLTLDGCDEDTVAIGDRFRWGEAVLEVCQPRAPCYKLALHTARPDVPQGMTLSARCGWYFRIIEEGHAPAREAGLVRIARKDGPSVRDAFVALFNRTNDPQIMDRLLAVPELARSWRSALKAKRGEMRGS